MIHCSEKHSGRKSEARRKVVSARSRALRVPVNGCACTYILYSIYDVCRQRAATCAEEFCDPATSIGSNPYSLYNTLTRVLLLDLIQNSDKNRHKTLLYSYYVKPTKHNFVFYNIPLMEFYVTITNIYSTYDI